MFIRLEVKMMIERTIQYLSVGQCLDGLLSNKMSELLQQPCIDHIPVAFEAD